MNENELKNSAKHKIEAKQNVFTLTVNKCDHPDVGIYRAQVDNGIDHTQQTAKLNVGGMFFFCFNTSHFGSLFSKTKGGSTQTS
jgi:hypothetical protein